MDVTFYLIFGFSIKNGNSHPKTVTLYHFKMIFLRNGNFILDKRELYDE